MQHCEQVQFSADVMCEVFMTTIILTASAGYDTVYSGMWVPGGVGRLERVMGRPPEAEFKRRQNKYFKRKKKSRAFHKLWSSQPNGRKFSK